MQLSDIISIHAYCDNVCLQEVFRKTAQYDKPIMLTEWMARQVKSTYCSILPTLMEYNVGAYQWGLVKGKTQTFLPWPHVTGNDMTLWWHDTLDADGRFHSDNEGHVIRNFIYPQKNPYSALLGLPSLRPLSLSLMSSISDTESSSLEREQMNTIPYYVL